VCLPRAPLEQWLDVFKNAFGPQDAPFCPHLIMQRVNLAKELACLRRYRPEIVITSVGSPAPVIGPLHEADCIVYSRRRYCTAC
jgi:nitronate monooxygenase